MVTNIFAAVILTMGTLAVCEGVLIFGRMQLQLNHAEQILAACAKLLAAVPSKSAERTDGIDAKPQTWWQNLRDLPPIVDIVPTEAERHAMEIDDNPQTEPIVMPAPATQPDLKAAAKVKPLPVSYEDWRKDWDARVESDMAKIRGVK